MNVIKQLLTKSDDYQKSYDTPPHLQGLVKQNKNKRLVILLVVAVLITAAAVVGLDMMSKQVGEKSALIAKNTDGLSTPADKKASKSKESKREKELQALKGDIEPGSAPAAAPTTKTQAAPISVESEQRAQTADQPAKKPAEQPSMAKAETPQAAPSQLEQAGKAVETLKKTMAAADMSSALDMNTEKASAAPMPQQGGQQPVAPANVAPAQQPSVKQQSAPANNAPAAPPVKKLNITVTDIGDERPAGSATSANANRRMAKPPKMDRAAYLAKVKSDEIDKSLLVADEFVKSGDYRAALTEYKKLVGRTPIDYIILNQMAYLMLKDGRYEDAAAYAKQSVSVKDDYVPAIVNLAIAESGSNRMAEAERNFKKALALEPTDEFVIRNARLFREKQDALNDAGSGKLNDAGSGK